MASILPRIKNRYYGHPFRLFSAALKTVFVAHLFWTYGYTIEPCAGASMLPTISVLGDSMLISRSYRLGRNIKVGDIVAFNSVVEPGQHVIKRVVGMEGDIVLRDTPGVGDGMIQVCGV
jgi:inner membrane protease subunit 1